MKYFTKKLSSLTNTTCKFNVIWDNRKIKSLFPIKDKVKYYSCVKCLQTNSCKQSHIG